MKTIIGEKDLNVKLVSQTIQIDNSSALTAISLGASIIEKHLSLKNFEIDGKFSSDFDGMKNLKDSIKAWQSKGVTLFDQLK